MSTGQSSPSVVTVTTVVRTRQPAGVFADAARDGRIPRDKARITRWVVVATFVGIDGSEPRCVDYRVRVVPEVTAEDIERTYGVSGFDAPRFQWYTDHAGKELGERLADNAITPAEVAELGEIPAEGIPRFVFEEASQSRMLTMAREYARRHRFTVSDDARAFLGRQSRTKRRGRPPVRSMGDKLRILADVERMSTLQEVADAHAMSRSAVRDLVAWARHSAEPPLFTGTTPGRRGGELTDHARAMLAELDKESN